MYDRTVTSYIVLVDITIFYKRKKQVQYKISILHYCSKGDRCPLATARLTAGGTQVRLDLERDPLIRITEASFISCFTTFYCIDRSLLQF